MVTLLKGSAFITGAASGIGKSAALAFARHGVKCLAITDINKTGLESTRDALRAAFPDIEILPLHMDVRNTTQVRDSISATARAFGRLDIAVNNAGLGGSGDLTHLTPDEEIENVLDVNLSGVYRCQKAQLALMVEQEDLGPREGRGRIINVASMYGVVAPYHGISNTAYAASKHGVIGLTRGDANAYAGYNIRINAIAPGFIPTASTAHVLGMENSPLNSEVARTPLKRTGDVEEISDALVLMASTMNSFQQGAVHIVDGGFTSN